MRFKKLSDVTHTPQPERGAELKFEPAVSCSRTEHGLPCPSPGNLPNPGIELRSPALQADSLPAEPPGKGTWHVVGA